MKTLSPQWQPTLRAAGMEDFDSVWDMPLQRVDSPNQGRGGWSEVCRHDLAEPVFGVDTLYIKRQQDFGYREWPHITTARPTFQRECRNLLWCIKHGIPVVEPLAYDQKKVDGHQRAILITAGLTSYWPLSNIDQSGVLSEVKRRDLLRAIAQIVFHMHCQGLQHGCLYPKHIFVHNDFIATDNSDIRLIDLEKARPLSRWNGGVFRDLDSLNRRATSWTKAERLYFFEEYYRWDDSKKDALLERLVKSYRRKS